MSTTGTDQGVLDTRDMNVVHVGFRREYRLAPGLVRGVAAGDTARSAVVADHLQLCLDLLHHHHTGEDRLLWPRLLERVPEELAPIVHLMESHHEQVHGYMETVQELLPSWRASADPATGERLATALDGLYAILDEHLTAEEQRLLPIAARHISEAEWSQLGEEGFAAMPKSRIPLVFGMLMYEGDPEVIQQMLSHAPLLPRLLMPLLAPRAFRRYALRIHGTATP